ncbi:MAG: CHAT domain-containing protein [Anaerolineales bacterium]|nr:CHAT domain-containing protein [Anaerolineales bacterium]
MEAGPPTFPGAVRGGNLQIALDFLENGTDPNFLDQGERVLLYAGYMGNLLMVRLLLIKGADPNLPGESGFLPIHYAAAKNQLDVLALLLSYGARVDIPTPNGYLPLYDAAAEGNLEAARLLIEHGADVSAPGADHSTPLHAAADRGHAALAELLLEKGASPFTKNDQGITALMAAGIKERGKIMRMIANHRMAESLRLEANADLSVPDAARALCKEAASLRQNWDETSNLQKAEQLFRKAVEMFPNCWMGHFGLGEILTIKINNEGLSRGPEVEKALAELKYACQLGTGRREPQLKLAAEYAKTNMPVAESVFRRAVDRCDNYRGCLYPIDWQAADYFRFAILAANSHETLGLSLEAFCRAIILKPDYYGGEVKPADSLPAAIWTTALLVRPDGGQATFEKPDILPPELRAVIEQAEKQPWKIGQLHNASLMNYERYLNTRDPDSFQQALTLEKEAWDLAPADFPERYKIASHYGMLLQLHHDRTGETSDLFQSVDLFSYAASHASNTDPKKADYLDNLSIAFYHLYEHNGEQASVERSIECLNQAISLTPSLSPSLPLYLSRLGICYLTLYEASSAVSDLRKAMAVFDQALDRADVDAIDRPILLTHRGMGHRKLFHRTAEPGELTNAITDFEAAIKNTPDIPRNGNDLAIRLNNLANALLDRYRVLQQIEDLDRAIESLERAFKYEEKPARQANYARALLERYRVTQVWTDLEQSITIFKKAVERLPSQSPNYSGILLSLGVALGTRNRNDDLQQAIEYLERAADPKNTTAIGTALTAATALLDITFIKRAWSEAIDAYSKAIRAREHILETQILSDDKYLWLAETQDLPALGGYALAESERLDEAVEAIEAGRARLFGETLERSRLDLERLADPLVGRDDLLKRYREASNRYDELRRNEPLEGQSKTILGHPFERIEQIEAVQSRIQDTIAEIRQVPGYENFLCTFKSEQIKREAQGSSLVYLILSEAGGFAFVVDAGGTQKIRLDVTRSDLNDRINRSYLPAILDKSVRQAALSDILPWLGEKIMKKIAVALRARHDPSTPVILIPSGRLALLPLHAASYTLEDGEHIFLDDFEVSYTPSAQMLYHARSAVEQPGRSESFFGIGNPLPLPNEFTPLSFAEFEVKEILAFFSAHSTLYGDQATIEAVRKNLPSFSYLHFSCHGFFDPEAPLESGVILANGKTLTLSELMKSRQLSAARMAVLSACQTAMTDFNKLPEESIGLAAGFLQAGVPGVIGSLWPVDDLSTALVMKRFYHNHLCGARQPAAALCEAQRWLRDVTAGELLMHFEQQKPVPESVAAKGIIRFALEDPQSCPYRDQPYHWAPFVFLGA